MNDVAQPKLSGAVIVKNGCDRIRACVASLDFCDETVVIDTGSTDGTLDILRELDVKLVEREFTDFADSREAARLAATGEWILYLDADETLPPELAREIEGVIQADGPHSGYRIGLRSHFRSTWLKYGGYYPDFRLRLFRRELGAWDLGRPVHELVVLEGSTADLKSQIDHYPFESIPHCLEKAHWYAEMGADAMYARGRRVGAWGVFSHSAARFVRAYFFKRGFLGGGLGFAMSGLQGYETFQKYLRLWELTRLERDTS